jgi:hypothetical protein
MMDTYSDPSRNESFSFAVSVVYFVSLQVLASLVTINLFIAVMLEAFELMQQHKQNGSLFTMYDLGLFIDTWSQFDPSASEFMTVQNMIKFLFALGKPLGLDPEADKETEFRTLRALLISLNCRVLYNMRTGEGLVHYKDVLYNAMRVAFGTTLPRAPNVLVDDAFVKVLLRSAGLASSYEYNSIKIYIAAVIIQVCIFGFHEVVLSRFEYWFVFAEDVSTF